MKPFSLKKLHARVRALLRRTERAEVPAKLKLKSAEIDLQGRTLSVDGDERELNTKEMGILKLLIEFQGDVVTRDRFLDEVWGYHANPTSRTVDNFIAELRKKLGNYETMLKTVRGKGFRLDL